MAKRQSMRDKMKSKLKDRTKESYKNRDSGGSMKNYFDPDKMEGVSTWWAGKGDHILDIIPYFAGAHDPRNDKGEPAYVLDIEIHQKVGPMEEVIVCPEQYGDPCPICQKSRELNSEGADWKTEIKPLKPKHRVMYNIIVRDGGDMEKKGVQVYEISHYFMEKHLAKIAKDPRGGGFTVFSDPDDGKSISFERTGTGPKNTDYTGHRFVDRPEDITNEELEAAYCLDDLIKLYTYDEIYEIFYGKPATASEDEVDDTEPEEVETEEVEEEEVEEKAPKRTKKNKKRKNKKPVCPHGHVIGEDVDEYEECDDNCEMYDVCEEIADEL